ncbi:MAG TPA: thymidylate kinase, partial [Micromonospora sp.]
LVAADAAYRSLPEVGSFVPIDADRGPDEVARQIRAGLPDWLPRLPVRPAPRPAPPPPAVARRKAA